MLFISCVERFEIFVSPGTSSEFRNMVKNGSCQLPLYPTSLLLATDIELTVDMPFIFHTLPTLIQLSYDPHVSGEFGPFSFGPLHRASAGDMKFRVGVRDNKIAITLPGTQLFGYVSDVVPQHPRPATVNQSHCSPTQYNFEVTNSLRYATRLGLAIEKELTPHMYHNKGYVNKSYYLML